MSFLRTCLCLSSFFAWLLLLPCLLSGVLYNIHRQSLHIWCPFSEIEGKTLIRTLRLLTNRRKEEHDRNRGTAKTLTATRQSDRIAGLFGRSGRWPRNCCGNGNSEIDKRNWEYGEVAPGNRNTIIRHRQRVAGRQLSKSGLTRRAEQEASTFGGGRPFLRLRDCGRRRRPKHRLDNRRWYLRCSKKAENPADSTSERGERSRKRPTRDERGCRKKGTEKQEKPSDPKPQEERALTLLSNAYTYIWKQQKQLHHLELERLEALYQNPPPLKMPTPKNSESSSSAGSTSTAPPVTSLMDSQWARMGMMMPLPQPNTPGAPHFNGKNVSEFLKAWENLCEDYLVNPSDRLRKLPRYCGRLIRLYVETIPQFQANDWAGLKEVMLREYRHEDVDQQMETLSFLEAFKNQKRSDGDDMRQYCQRFAAVSKPLVLKGELSAYEQVKWFIQGMPDKMADRTARAAKLDPLRPETMRFKEAFDASISLIQSNEAREAFRNPSQQQDAALKELAKKVETQKTDSSEVNWDLTAPVSITVPEVEDKALEILSKGMAALKLDMQAVEHLEQLKATIHQLEAKVNAMGARSLSGENTIRRQEPRTDSLNLSQGSMLCFYCGGNHQMNGCSRMREDMQGGRLHRNEQGRLCIGPVGSGGAEISKPRNTLWKDALAGAAARAERYRDSLATARSMKPQAGVSYISAIEQPSDSEEELPAEDDYCNTAIVNAATAAPPARRGRPPKNNIGTQGDGHRVHKPVVPPGTQGQHNMERAQRALDAEQQYPVMRAPRTGTYEHNREPMDVEPTIDQSSSFGGQPDVRKDKEAVREKGEASKPPRTKLSKLLKGNLHAEALTDEILSTKVPIPIGQLLSIKEMQRVWFNTFPAPPGLLSADVAVHSLGTTSEEGRTEGVENRKAYYIAATPKVRTVVEGQERSVLLDSGAEVNIIDLEVAHELGLPVSTNVDLGMAQAVAPSTKFVGLVEDVRVAVGKIEHEVPMWVAKNFSLGLLLGRPYHVQARVKTDDRGDGSCYAKILSADGNQMVTIQAVSVDASQNRTKEDLIRSGTLNAPADI